MNTRMTCRPQLFVIGLASAAVAACSPEKAPDARRAVDSSLPRSASAAVPAEMRRSDSSAPQPKAPRSRPAQAASTPTGLRRVLLGDLDLTGIGHDRGSATAPVVMIDLSDFACPYCGEFSLETYPVIERDYVKTGKVFFKYVPFIVGSFPHSREATRATECAADQGAFWPMMTRVYETQGQWKKGGDPFPLLSDIASAAGLDTARFGECYASKRTDARTARATNLASDVGVRVTPSFIVNGRPIQGALPLADFRKVIEAALLVSRMPK